MAKKDDKKKGPAKKDAQPGKSTGGKDKGAFQDPKPPKGPPSKDGHSTKKEQKGKDKYEGGGDTGPGYKKKG